MNREEKQLVTKIIITGGRDFDDYDLMRDTLLDFTWGVATVIHGAAPGADSLASRWAYENAINVLPYGAKWRRYGSSAGGRRNSLMLAHHPGVPVVAFPTENSRGTWDCVRKAELLGHRVIVARRE